MFLPVMVRTLRKKGRLYQARVRLDGWPNARYFSLRVSDRRVAEHKLEKLVQKLEMQAVGILPPDVVLNAAASPILVQLEAFLGDTHARGRAVNTVKAYRRCIPLLCRRCGWVYFRDISAESFGRWRESVSPAREFGRVTLDLQGSDGPGSAPGGARGRGAAGRADSRLARGPLAPKYLNDLLTYMGTFLAWCERRGLIDRDPLRHVQPVRLKPGRGYRRALSPEEFRRLLAVVPRQRATIYLVAYYLGLRRAEMNLLKRGDFDLDSGNPTVRIPASISKNGRAEQFELRSEVVSSLRAFWPADLAPFAWAFHGQVPQMETLKRDLVRAGIPFLDGEGRRFDFHALREMLCTHLHEAGVPMRVAMAMMRHSDARLTMRVYTDEARIPVSEGVARLPSFNAFEQPA